MMVYLRAVVATLGIFLAPQAWAYQPITVDMVWDEFVHEDCLPALQAGRDMDRQYSEPAERRVSGRSAYEVWTFSDWPIRMEAWFERRDDRSDDWTMVACRVELSGVPSPPVTSDIHDGTFSALLGNASSGITDLIRGSGGFETEGNATSERNRRHAIVCNGPSKRKSVGVRFVADADEESLVLEASVIDRPFAQCRKAN